MNIRLEYSPLVGQFNQAQASDIPDATKGFKTLCCFMNTDRATRFVEAIALKYPALASGTASQFPSLREMQRQLIEFIKEDVEQLKKHMSQTFQRRKSIFTNHS